MKYVEIILKFLTVVIRTIFPRKEVFTDPRPHGPGLPLPPDAGDGGDTGGHRGDPLARSGRSPSPYPRPGGIDWLGLSGYTLMVAGGAGWIARYLL